MRERDKESSFKCVPKCQNSCEMSERSEGVREKSTNYALDGKKAWIYALVEG